MLTITINRDSVAKHLRDCEIINTDHYFNMTAISLVIFSARCNIYILRLYAMMSVSVCLSVCDGSALAHYIANFS